MSISLNDHESRIKSLENISSQSGYYEKVLWSSTAGAQPATITTNENIENFNMLAIKSNNMGFIFNIKILPVTYVKGDKEVDFFTGTDMSSGRGRRLGITGSNKTLKITYVDVGGWGKIYEIRGIKFSKVILYNFSYIIKSISKFTSSILSRRRCESRDVY